MHTNRGVVALAAIVAVLLASSGAAHGVQNVALGALATSSALLPCSLGSGPENAVDGAASNIYTDKWCVQSGRPTLTLTLPGSPTGYSVSYIVVKHAGVAGESAALNTRAFRILATTSPQSAPVVVATVTANTANVTELSVSLENVSQIQLAIDTPTQGANQATRIYEVEVWGEPSQTTNVALGAMALGSALPCSLGSGPENAVDGAASNIFTDKWCVASARPTLTLTLLGSLTGYTVSHIIVKHAGVAETPAMNTRAFTLAAATSPLGPWVTVAAVTNNSASQTTHPVNLEGVTQVRLAINVPTQTLDPATRIYEVEVWGRPTAPPPVLPLEEFTSCMNNFNDLEYCCFASYNAPSSQCSQVPGWTP